MDGFWGGVVGGALAGILLMLGERFLFSAPEAWLGVKRSFRFYRQRWWARKGRNVIHCPHCLRPHPDSVVDEAVLPDGWDDAPEGVHWLRCPEGAYVWGLQTVITAFRPVPTETAEAKKREPEAHP